VAQNYAEALKWFHLAANQGLPQAQSALAACYHDGQGIPQNNIEAIKWLGKLLIKGIRKLRSAYRILKCKRTL
jgi:TPR repeat protein